MDRHRELEQAIAETHNAINALEAQRALLGDAVVDAALSGLRRKLADLEAETRPVPSTPTLAGERKLVTVMFADLSGFTSMAETMDPESVRDLMNACFEWLVPVIEKYDGTLDKFIGDEMMVLFGAPAAHENDPERALRTALEMIEALDTFNAERGFDLGLHFGINTGLVIAGGIGTEERQEYSVMGDAVNLAKRLEDSSGRAEILVGPDTYRQTAPLFNFVELGPIRIKGRAEPVPAYRLVGPRVQPGRVRGLESHGISSPLVGRQVEFAALQGTLERLLEGEGGIALVLGEAGVGKSRLTTEVRRHFVAAESGGRLRWLEGRSLSFSQSISYWPFHDILWQWAGITEEDSEATAWQKLETHVSTLFDKGTAEVLPYLATMLTLNVRDEYAERVKYLDGEAMGRQLFLASRRFFERLAQERPLVLVFEDLHWADNSSAGLLEHLLPLTASVPLLIVGISRPGPQTPVGHLQQMATQSYIERYTEIHLSALSRRDSTRLVSNLLEVERLSPHVREMMIQRAEGNPFYLEEIIRALIGIGAVACDPESGCWQATTELETISIPDTIQGVIMARVDRLAEDVKQVLRTASVIGRSFFYRVLRAVTQAGRDLDPHLVELQMSEFIREKRRLPELEYIFKHALAQETTYESILLQKRRSLHRQVGQAIEVLFADRLEEFYGLLAYHYARAEAWEKAQEYLLRAGDLAGRMAADAEALSYYEQATAAYTRIFGERWDPLQRATLERKIGEALFRRGEHQQALDYLQRALDHLGKPLPRPEQMRPTILRQVLQQLGHRLRPGFPRLQAGEIPPEIEEELRLYEPIGWIAGWTNPELFLVLTLRGLNVAERSGYPYGIVVGSMGLGTILDFIPLFGLAASYHGRAAALAAQLQHPGALVLAYAGLAMHKSCRGEWPAAMDYARRAAAISQDTGDLHSWGHASSMLVTAWNYQGKLHQALELCQDVVRLGQEGGDPQVQSWGLWTQGYALRRLGRLEEAASSLQQAVALAQGVPDYSTLTAASGELARCYLDLGQYEQAQATLRESQQVYAQYGTHWGNNIPLGNGLAQASLLALEQNQAAPGDGLQRQARQACRVALKQARTYRGGLPEAMLLQGRYEWLRGRAAAARRWWQRGLLLAEKMGQRYDQGLLHLELGRRLDRPAHLERAEDIFGELGQPSEQPRQ